MEEIVKTLKGHQYILHGGGEDVGEKNLDGTPKLFSKSAGKILREINKKTKNGDYLPLREYDAIFAMINNELKNKTQPTRWGWFFGIGARDQSTAKLYRDILGICNPDNVSSPKGAASFKM